MIRVKLTIAAVAAALLGAAATVYIVLSADHETPAVTGQVGFAEPERLYFLDGGQVTSVALDDPQGPRKPAGLRCERFHTAGGVAVCLIAVAGLVPTAKALVLTGDGSQPRRVNVAGTISRARVSASGRMVSWTTFVTGDSYAAAGFSTRTSILDLKSGQLVVNMETIQLYLDGKRHYAPDVNYWGVTFSGDDNMFYATVSTGGRTYLIRGDVERWRAEDLRNNVECPSLSPDGTRIAFKKRVADGARPWRLAVLELATMRETELPGTDGVDDQALWLDDHALAYGLDGKLWTVPADGSRPPKLLVDNGMSPAVAVDASPAAWKAEQAGS